MRKNFLYFPPRSVPIFKMKPIPTVAITNAPRINSVSMRLNQRCDIKQPSLKGQSCLLRKPSNLLMRLQSESKVFKIKRLIPITALDKTPSIMI